MLNGHMYHENNFNTIYHSLLMDIFRAPNHEVMGVSYTLTDPTSLAVDNSVRAFSLENADKMLQWILSGADNADEMEKVNKNAKQFNREVNGRNAFYGPRILAQIDGVVDELVDNPDSRRACILVLDAADQVFLEPKRKGETIEYPCTAMLTYTMRNGFLHANTVMRSNNVVSTICYDNYNFCKLQMEVLKMYNALSGKSATYGYYMHYIVNAHILPGDTDKARLILEEKYGDVDKLTRI